MSWRPWAVSWDEYGAGAELQALAGRDLNAPTCTGTR